MTIKLNQKQKETGNESRNNEEKTAQILRPTPFIVPPTWESFQNPIKIIASKSKFAVLIGATCFQI